MTPTARTLAHLRTLGYRAHVVEQNVRIPPKYPGGSPKIFKRDLFGCIDIVAMRPGEPLLAIQCTTTQMLNRRMAKDPETCRMWLSTGNRFEFWGWRVGGKKGRRKTAVLTKRTVEVP